MADKFVDVSAAYNGDGTTSAQATVDGGVGAWNDLAEIATTSPSVGTLAGNDNVYIRCADSGGGLSANITSFSDWTDDYSIIHYHFGHSDWVDNGEFNIICSGNFTFGRNIHIHGNHKMYITTSSNSSSSYSLRFDGCLVGGFDFRGNTDPNATANYHIQANSYYHSTVYDSNINHSKINTYLQQLVQLSNRGCLDLINVVIDVSCVDINPGAVFKSPAGYGGKLTWTGGGIITSNAQSFPLMRSKGGVDFFLSSVSIPQNLLNYEPYTDIYYSNILNASIIDIPERPNDYFHCSNNAIFDYAASGNYPTLNATLPTGGYWSLKLRTSSACNPIRPASCPLFKKFYDNASGTKQLTVNVLVNDNYGVPAEFDIWTVFTYVDISGITRTETVTTPAPSTAAWSADFYASQNYNKYMLSLDTSYQVQQNTMITAKTYIGIPPTQLGDFMFFCPDIGVA